ncbi:preprotein translocase subunit SecE [Canibacter sp. lx-72]|uniref:preprotein translocase subunit SecE n=1 Tax=Canibacter zhuwentaonis TaxID=2837491 RepID=UPI001BDCB4C1|nr:preprotein translocase subunit SecE [Canibacter zhuwentaonis]MBT1035848.1 preprotein translocase subunit SecE [Canibacter zhuwentaonis]
MSSSEVQSAASISGQTQSGKKPNFVMRIVLFIKEVIAELKKVTTPTRKQLWNYFLVVLGFVLIMMAFVWLLDQAFGWLAITIFGSAI